MDLVQPPDVLVADTQQSVITVESRDADNDNTQQHKKKQGRPKKATLATSKATSASSGAVPKIKPIQHCVPQCNHGRAETSVEDMVRCGLCMAWLHASCVGHSKEDADHKGRGPARSAAASLQTSPLRYVRFVSCVLWWRASVR